MILPPNIYKKLKRKGYDIQKIEERKKGVYYLNTNKGWVVLKMKIRRHHWLLELFGARNICFTNECIFYDNFSKMDTRNFNVPKLLETDFKNFLMIEFIPGPYRYHLTDIKKENMAKALVEFQTSELIYPPQKKIRLLEKFLVIDYIWILRLIRIKKIRLLFKILKQKIMLSGRYSKRYMFISNNDARNIIEKEDDETIYFYDFGTTTINSRISLRDISHLATKKGDIDTGLVKEYLCLLKEKGFEFDSKRLLRRHLIEEFISHMMRKLKAGRDFDKKYFDFLEKTLLNNDNYEKWYNKRIGL